jgi:hypothetical protein
MQPTPLRVHKIVAFLKRKPSSAYSRFISGGAADGQAVGPQLITPGSYRTPDGLAVQDVLESRPIRTGHCYHSSVAARLYFAATDE